MIQDQVQSIAPQTGELYLEAGQSKRKVLATAFADHLQFSDAQGTVNWPWEQVKISLGGGVNAAKVEHQGGGVFVPLPVGRESNDWLRSVTRKQPKRSARSRVWITLSLLLVITVALLASGWYGLRYGTSALAGWVAPKVPLEWEKKLGDDTPSMLEGEGFKPSSLSEARRKEIDAIFEQAKNASLALNPTSPMLKEAKLLYRSSPVGPNAFALPGGTIVMTDEMVKLAEPLGKGADTALMGVLAHELGHVHHRHVVQNLISQSFTAGLVFLIVGDVSGLSGLAVLLPTVLLNSAHSREFEAESDDFAITALNQSQQSTLPVAQLFESLEAWARRKQAGEIEFPEPKNGSSKTDGAEPPTDRDAKESKTESKAESKVGGAAKDVQNTGVPGKLEKLSSYLQSHPATGDRIEKLRKANRFPAP